MATVVCLDDYHSLDRTGRKEKGVTALAPESQNFDMMYEHVKAIKEGKTVQKPIYNHVTGKLDPPEEIKAPRVRHLARVARLLLLSCVRPQEFLVLNIEWCDQPTPTYRPGQSLLLNRTQVERCPAGPA